MLIAARSSQDFACCWRATASACSKYCCAFATSGSGDINARNFATRKVNVSVSGSGDAHVNATEALEARVAGSGDVTYSGHPRDVSRHVSGSGSIESAN